MSWLIVATRLSYWTKEAVNNQVFPRNSLHCKAIMANECGSTNKFEWQVINFVERNINEALAVCPTKIDDAQVEMAERSRHDWWRTFQWANRTASIDLQLGQFQRLQMLAVLYNDTYTPAWRKDKEVLDQYNNMHNRLPRVQLAPIASHEHEWRQ